MDTITAPPLPVAAPAAVTPPPITAPETPKTPINTVTGKPISEAAHSLFKMLEASGDPLREEPKPEPKAEPAAPTKTEPPATVEPEPPIKVSKRPAKRPELPKESPAAVAAPPAAAPAAPSPGWEDSLLDDEKAALEDARFAEQVNPKHKGLGDKMGRFFREQKEYLEKHPDVDDEDPDYKRILSTMPGLSASDKREIAEARIVQRVSKEYEPKLTDLQHELYVRDEEPKVENEANQIRRHLAFNALPKEMLTVLKEKGLPVLQKEYADELKVAGRLINTFTEDARELLRIMRINPKTQRAVSQPADNPTHPKWDQHNRIVTMVNEVCAEFQKTAPQAEQVRNGKWFVTRDEWAKLAPGARHQFWTFTNSEDHAREIIQRAMSWMPDAISKTIKDRQDELKALGYVRQRAEPAAPPPPTPPVASSGAASPRPAPTPAPSAAPAGQKTPGQLLAARLAGE